MDRARLVILLFGALSWAESVPDSRKSRSDQWKRKDLFGFEEMDYTPLDQVPYSSYLGELAPFWSFRTNGKFNLIDINEEPRRRARAAFDLAWRRLGRGIPTAQDRIDGSASEEEDTDQDPEPPKRPEEFISEHEKPRDVPTRPKYGVPGGWAKGNMPDKKVDIGFVPLQIYSQTRRYDIEEHLPRERALEEAETDEEKLAAPRLREVLRNKKLHEIYEEEGYEDLGYNHGGYNHHGEKEEDVVKNEDSIIKKLPTNIAERDTDPKEAKTIAVYSPISTDRSAENSDEKEPNGSHLTNKGSNLDLESIEGGDALKHRKAVIKSAKKKPTIHVPNISVISDRVDVAESRSGSSLESRIVNNPSSKIIFPGKSTRRLYTSWDIRPQDGQVEETVVAPQPPVVNVHHVASYSPYRFNDPTVTPVQFSASTPMQFASTINTYASLINQNFSTPLVNGPIEYSEYDSILPSYSTDDYVWAHSNVHEQRVPTSKPIKFEEEVITPDATTTKSTVSVDLPTPTENSKKQPGRQRGRRRGNAQSSTTLSVTAEDTHTNIELTTEPTKSIRKTSTNAQRKTYSNFTRGSVKYNPEDDTQWTPTVGTPNIRHPSLPFDNGENKETKVVKPTKEPEVTKTPSNEMPITRKPGKEEKVAIRDPAANVKYVEQLTLAHFSVPANLAPHPPHSNEQDERLKELAKQLNSPDTFENSERLRNKRSAIVYDKNKYPLYDSPPSISMDSAVKYATNPNEIPKKTYGGMEFYESKESIKCSGPPQPKNILPERKEDGEWKGEPTNGGPRIKGVGDAIDCFKKKYFGQEPLDNPLFKEEDAETAEKFENVENFQDSIPLKIKTVDPGERRIMIYGQNPVSNLTADFKISEPVVKTKFSPYTSRPFVDTVTFTTPHPLSLYNTQYQVYEVNPDDTATPSPYKYKHYYSLHPSKFQYQMQMVRPQKYVPHKLSAYQFVSENTIPTIQKAVPYSSGGIKVIPHSGAKQTTASYSSGLYRTPIFVRPTEYLEKKIIIRKRETESSLWDMINPLKWWWPNLFDSRRKEPRFRRSIEDYDSVMPSSKEIDEVGREMIEMMASEKSTTTTTVPITLSEFKSKLNIPEPKKTTARLTGGFLNRNADITDVIEMLVGMGPTDMTSKETTPVSTTKPKVVFPRAKLPRRKTYPGTKKPSVISELPTTEATTTTTTTTVPPSTTTRMYKPKRVIKKNYGKGPVDAFTILRMQQEVKATKQTYESTEAVDKPAMMRHQQDEPKTLSSETAGENDTLTYMVNPVTGVGSWSEQRKWKPKRKRPNRPSVYSYHRLKNSSSKKKQRDISDPHRKVYVYGLMSKIMSPGSRESSTAESSGEQISRRSSEEQYPQDAPVASVKPPPKFILEPDKRRYYYAKVR